MPDWNPARIEILDGPRLFEAAAAHIEQAAQSSVALRGRFAVAFSGGSTPAPLFDALVARAMPWEQTHVFQVDERLAPTGTADRNLTELRRRLLDCVPVSDRNIHPLAVDREPAEAATQLHNDLQRCGGLLDLVHLGLGADGHTASLVPGDPVCTVLDRSVARTLPYQGLRRLTLTAPVLRQATHRLWLITGSGKAAAFKQLMDGADIPATSVRCDGDAVFADVAASAMTPWGAEDQHAERPPLPSATTSRSSTHDRASACSRGRATPP